MYSAETVLANRVTADTTIDRWDWVYHTTDGQLVAVDFDGGYYHQADRLERDRQKTLEVIKKNVAACAIRVRVNAAHLMIRHPRIHILTTTKFNPASLAYRVLQVTHGDSTINNQ